MARIKTPAALAAAQIRKHLKSNGIKAKVRSQNYFGGSSIRVELTDELPATVKAIEGYCSQFQAGHFDGMTDMYEYSNNRDDIPQVSFVFVRCEYTSEVKQACYVWLKSYYANFDDVEGLTIWWSENRNTYIPGFDTDLGTVIHRELHNDKSGGFWSTRKQHIAA